MASSGPNYPSSGASLANSGTSENANAWSSPENVGSSSAVASITAPTFDSPDISEILVASDFGFAIGPTATITGVTVEISKRGYTSANSGKDFRVQLATGTAFANLVGDNKASASVWPQTTLTTTTYGSSSDTWNAGLTVAQVNATGFAVFVSAYANVANADIEVDWIRVTLEYTTPPNTNANASVATATGAANADTAKVEARGTGAATATGAALNATADTGLYAADDFSDDQTDNWGSADTGGEWTESTPADFDKASGVGTIVLGAAGTRTGTLETVSAADHAGDIKFKAPPNTGSGYTHYLRLQVRSDATHANGYVYYIQVNSDGTVDVTLRKRTSSSDATVATWSNLVTGYSDATWYRFRWQAENSGSDVILRGRLWESGGTEPASWQSYTDTAPGSPWTGAGSFRIIPQTLAAYTGSFPVTFTFDDLVIGAIAADADATTEVATATGAANASTAKVEARGTGAGAGTGAALDATADVASPGTYFNADVATGTAAAIIAHMNLSASAGYAQGRSA